MIEHCGPPYVRECPLCHDRYTGNPTAHFVDHCVYEKGCPSCGQKCRTIAHARTCAELMDICYLLELGKPSPKKDDRPIPEQVKGSDWWSKEVPKDGVTIIDERGGRGKVS